MRPRFAHRRAECVGAAYAALISLAVGALLGAGASIGFYSGDIKMLQDDILTLKPTVFCGVPRIYQRFYERAMQKISQLPLGLKSLFSHALAVSFVLSVLAVGPLGPGPLLPPCWPGPIALMYGLTREPNLVYCWRFCELPALESAEYPSEAG